MFNQSHQRRTKSQFHKGMTLQQYLRVMEVDEETLPTADSHLGQQEQEQCLYKTSHQFYDPNSKRVQSIRQIEQENFDDSMDVYRENVNIVSTNLKPMAKRKIIDAPHFQEPRKSYRIRDGKSMSPYQMTYNKNTISPYKTYMKKFYVPENETKIEQDQSKQSMLVRTLYGKQFEPRKSTKNIKVQPLPSHNYKKLDYHGDYKVPQISQNQRLSMKGADIQKFDVRIETLKDRLQMKRKNKNK